MRELHVVAVSEDGRHVLLASRRGTTAVSYRVALDDHLMAAVRGDLPRPGEDPTAASALSPKEIQARLRAGESAADIARSAGVPVTRVERFSGPVQGEMARVIDAARSAYLVRGRLGRSLLPLGRAVDRALDEAAGLRPDSVDWQTRRAPEGHWLVTVQWFSRARLRSASWRYDPVTREVTGVDSAAAALAHAVEEEAPRRRGDAKPTTPAAKKVASAKAPAKQTAKAPAKKAPATKTSTKKTPAKKAPATKTSTKKTPAKKAPATKSPAKKTPAAKGPAKKGPASKALSPKAPAGTSVDAKAPAKRASASRRGLRVVPDPTPRSRTAAQTPSTAERDGVRTRASVPAWADVLLGTTPGADR